MNDDGGDKEPCEDKSHVSKFQLQWNRPLATHSIRKFFRIALAGLVAKIWFRKPLPRQIDILNNNNRSVQWLTPCLLHQELLLYDK